MPSGLISRARTDLRHTWRAVFGFHLSMQLLGAALLTPLIVWLANRIVAASGSGVISNFDIVGFVLSPTGAVFVLLVAALVIGLTLAELAGHGWICGHAIARRPVTTLEALAAIARRLPSLVILSAQIFVRLLALLLPFLAVAALVWFTRFAGQDINYYLAEKPPEWRRAVLLVGALFGVYAILAAWLLARWVYALPALVFDRRRPAEALRCSRDMTRGRLLRIVAPLAGWWLALTAAAALLALLGREVSDAALDAAGIDLRGILPIVAVCVAVTIVFALIYGTLQLAGHQFLVTRMFAEQVDAARWTVPDESAAGAPARRIGRSALLLGAAVLALAAGTAAILFARLDLKSDVAVTAHRGASLDAPENSMAAFRAAIDAGADYIELDVQRTSDGAIAVVHDGDFLRLAGDPRRIGEVQSSDLAAIDIGRKRDARFAGEHVPLLEDVIALARGRIKLNVELKYNVPDAALAPAVIELLRREAFIEQVVVTSLDYAALLQVESLEPRLETGHIVSAAVGDVAKTRADFVSLNSAQAKPALLRRAHAAGKEVHVWTVNTREAMLRMIELGVDNVITDDPAMLVQLMRERNALAAPQVLGLRLRVLYGRPPPELVSPAAVPVI